MRQSFLLLLFLLCPFASAQEYAFRSFTVNDGLVSNYITAMEQDSRGVLWVGTDEGFSQFDGGTFRNIRPPKRPMWGHINTFCESRALPGVMWIATNGGGVLRFADGQYRMLSVDTLLTANRVNDLLEDAQGILWCSTDNGVYRMEGGSFRHVPLPTRVGQETAQLFAAGDGTLWIVYPFGLLSYDPRTGAVREPVNTFIGGLNRQIAVAGPDTFFISREHLLRCRNGRFSRVPHFPADQFTILAVAPDERLWCGTTTGVMMVRREGKELRIEHRFDRTSGLPVNDVSTIVPGREGEIWFGTPGKGIVRLQDPQNFRFRFDALTARGTSDAAGRIWVPTLSGMYLVEQRPDRQWNSLPSAAAVRVSP